MAILGGSFNPPHIGHLRLAIEVLEGCSSFLDRVLLVPSARPPHKQGEDMLPFPMRCALVEASVASLEGIEVSRIEGERDALSYTWDTLSAFRAFCPDTALYFVLGSDDYEQIGDWYRGRELPTITNFIVVPRGPFDADQCQRVTCALWPGARKRATGDVGSLGPASQGSSAVFFELPAGTISVFLPLPSMDISATDIRRRWRNQRSLAYLLPEPVLRGLARDRALVTRSWSQS